MSSLFAGLKEKFADKLAEFKGSTAPQDPLEKEAADLVDKATSDGLIAPDWTLNLAVVDFINGEVRLHSGRTLKAIKRNLAKHNTKVQLLSLTLLETCVKNCTVEFHTHLATSELWAEIVKLAGDTSITRVDAEVRDKMLGMVEDFARALQPSQFQAAYESLLDRGIDFPVRGSDGAVPILTPPSPHGAAAAAAASGDQAAAAMAQPVEGAAVGAVAAADGGADPLAGMDERDRAAIRAALAELEAEAQAAQEAERVAAAADAEAHAALQQQQQLQREAAEAEAAVSLVAAAATTDAAQAAAAAEAAAAAAQGAVAAEGPLSPPLPQEQQQVMGDAHQGVGGEQQPMQQPMPVAQEQEADKPEERTAMLLETASNSTLLLSEMLASVPETEPVAVREPYVAELADTCVRLRSRLESELETLADEGLLVSAISQHEELSRVLSRYDQLLAAAEAVAPTVPRNAAAVALSHAAIGQGLGQGAEGHDQQHQHPEPPHGALAAVPAGQKVAAAAAAFKEKFTGAFDKFMAAATSARAPAPAQPSGAAAAGAGASGAVTTSGDAAGASAGGAFTLLDEEEDEANEGTALMTKRTTAPQAAMQPQQPQPQLQLQQLLQEATAVAPAAAPPAAAPAPLATDLINFEDEAPLAPAEPAVAAVAPAEQDAAAAAPLGGAAAAANDDGGELLSGLDIHGAGDPPVAAAPLAAFAAAAAEAQSPPVLKPVSRGTSNADQLVEALDRLVSLDSVPTSPVGSQVAAEAAAGAGGATPEEDTQQQQQ